MRASAALAAVLLNSVGAMGYGATPPPAPGPSETAFPTAYPTAFPIGACDGQSQSSCEAAPNCEWVSIEGGYGTLSWYCRDAQPPQLGGGGTQPTTQQPATAQLTTIAQQTTAQPATTASTTKGPTMAVANPDGIGSETPPEDGGSNPGAAAGIILGVLGLCGIGAFVAMYVKRRHSNAGVATEGTSTLCTLYEVQTDEKTVQERGLDVVPTEATI